MPQEPLTIEDFAGAKHGSRVLRLKGPLTISRLFDFQARVCASNSRAVPYISAGIGALVGADVNYQKEGRSLALVG